MNSYSSLRIRVSRSSALLLLGFAAAVFAAGCGEPKGTVTGVVKYKDKIVKGGTVTFVSKSGKASGSSSIAEDGTYTVSNIPVGEVQISVETSSMKPSGMDVGHKYQPPKEAPPEAAAGLGGGKSKDRYVAIPESYADPMRSGLAYTVQVGQQEHPIDLK
jgi:hypothetical protein